MNEERLLQKGDTVVITFPSKRTTVARFCEYVNNVYVFENYTGEFGITAQMVERDGYLFHIEEEVAYAV